MLIDYLRYEAVLHPDEPWLRSPDLSGQDITLQPIFEKEALSIIDSYVPLDFDMKSIDQYPFK